MCGLLLSYLLWIWSSNHCSAMQVAGALRSLGLTYLHTGVNIRHVFLPSIHSPVSGNTFPILGRRGTTSSPLSDHVHWVGLIILWFQTWVWVLGLANMNGATPSSPVWLPKCGHAVEARMMECRPRPLTGITGEDSPCPHRMAISWEVRWPLCLHAGKPCLQKVDLGLGKKASWTPCVHFRSHLCQKLDFTVT